MAAMRLNNGSADREADSHAIRLAGDEWLKQMISDLRTDARPRVRHCEKRKLAVALGVNREFATARRFHRLNGVSNQVKRDLLNLDLVDDDIWKLAIAAQRYPNALLSCTHQRKGGGLLEKRGRIFQRMVRFALGDKLPQPLDDVAGAKSLIRASIECVTNPGPIDGLVFQEGCGPTQIAGDRRQRLVQFVRQ